MNLEVSCCANLNSLFDNIDIPKVVNLTLERSKWDSGSDQSRTMNLSQLEVLICDELIKTTEKEDFPKIKKIELDMNMADGIAFLKNIYWSNEHERYR